MRPPTGRLAGAAALALGLAACKPDGVGYVEIKTVPATSSPALYLELDQARPGP